MGDAHPEAGSNNTRLSSKNDLNLHFLENNSDQTDLPT